MLTLVYALTALLVLIGIISSIYMIMTVLLRPKAQGRFVVVIPAGASQEDTAALLCAARLRVGLLGDIVRSEVIALDCGMSEACRAQCEALCHELDRTALVQPEELLRLLTR